VKILAEKLGLDIDESAESTIALELMSRDLEWPAGFSR
jgi:hypothetical protein